MVMTNAERQRCYRGAPRCRRACPGPPTAAEALGRRVCDVVLDALDVELALGFGRD